MNANNASTVPAMADTGDSFSSSVLRWADFPSIYPTSIAATTSSVVATKMNHIGKLSMSIDTSRIHKRNRRTSPGKNEQGLIEIQLTRAPAASMLRTDFIGDIPWQ